MENYEAEDKIRAMLEECTKSSDTWKNVFDFILHSRAYLCDRRKIENIVGALIHKLLFSDCGSQDVVLRVFCVYHRWVNPPLGLTTTRYEMTQAIMNYILEPLDFLNCYQLHDTVDGYFFKAVDHGNLNIVKLLVKYGLIFQDKDSPSFVSGGGHFIAWIKFLIKRHLLLYQVGSDLISYMDSSKKIFDTISQRQGELGNNQRGFRRFLILLRVLGKILDYYNLDAAYVNNHLQCLRIYFNAINEPYIAQDELEDFLKLLFKDEEKCEEIVEYLINTYRRMLRLENTLVYEPRTLKHQARCAVRKHLSNQTRRETLPNLVSQLNVPLAIKELLLGGPEFYS